VTDPTWDTQRTGPQGLLTPQALLLRSADDLALRFVFGKETVERYVFDSYTALARTATVTTRLPTLAVRSARDRLNALARAEGQVSRDVREVLFVCAHNAGRSQLAMALTNKHAGGAVHVPLRPRGAYVPQKATGIGCESVARSRRRPVERCAYPLLLGCRVLDKEARKSDGLPKIVST
jgi:hypothetical protein